MQSICPATEFDPLKPDYTLLNQLILEKINQKRAIKNKPSYILNEHLQKSADFYTQKYVLKKFENTSENKLFINKKVRKICRDNGYNPRLIDFSLNKFRAIKFFGKNYYYDKDDDKSPLHLYLGSEKPTKKEKKKDDFESKPLKLYNYEELAEIVAEKIMHDSGRNKALNGAYNQVGLSCVIEPKSIGRKKLPELKTMMIIGGKIITWE